MSKNRCFPNYFHEPYSWVKFRIVSTPTIQLIKITGNIQILRFLYNLDKIIEKNSPIMSRRKSRCSC